MADDWQAGDEGVCILNGHWSLESAHPDWKWPRKGDRVKVTGVVPDDRRICCGKCFLELAGFEPRVFCSAQFRKLLRDDKPSADGARLTEMIKGFGEKVPA